MENVITAGLASGWKVSDGSTLQVDKEIEGDVVVIGTGAGGGMAAETLAAAGLRVIMVEEGPFKHAGDFHMRETEAYPDLYQEAAARKTKDKAITILQGRCVGGGTTVNWTSSFATPPETLAHWAKHHGVSGRGVEEMQPWFDEAFKRLNIHQWPVPPNANNAVLQRGAEKLGLEFSFMQRNVNGCANLGYCGVGCPIDAKQSMLITAIPAALDQGARLLSRVRAQRLVFKGDRIDHLECLALDERSSHPTGVRITLKARHFVAAGGAIGTPALLLRSDAPDPKRITGKRTFLHPVNIIAATMPEEIHPYSGAPQTVYTDHFLWQDDPAGRLGYKLEVPPLYPLLTSTVLDGFGRDHHRLMSKLPRMHAMLALCRDGFNPQSQGGDVKLRNDGNPVLDYQLNEYIFEGMRRAYLSMAELQFAAGAIEVMPMHRQVREPYKSWGEAKKALETLELAPLEVRIASAHVMGGCPMGDDPAQALVSSEGDHHHIENLTVCDGSVFPTSIGTNPQVSIYGVSLANSHALARRLTASA